MPTLLTRKQSDFAEYLLSFYGKDGVYGPTNPRPIFRRPMTKNEAFLAAAAVGANKDFEGDSLDREKARDLVLSWRDRKSKKPRGWSTIAPSCATRSEQSSACNGRCAGSASFTALS